MVAHNPTEEKLLAMYERIGMGNCRTCSICRDNVENLSPPVTAWGVGNNFTNEHKKILFVGKNARGYFSKPPSMTAVNFGKTVGLTGATRAKSPAKFSATIPSSISRSLISSSVIIRPIKIPRRI